MVADNILTDVIDRSVYPFVGTPLKRQALDICIYGKKSRGKSFILAILGFLAFLEGKTVFSNMYLEYPSVYVGSLEDVENMKNFEGKKVFIGDDLEGWISSKFISNEDKKNILSFTLNAAKYQCDLYWTVKRPLEGDKTLRSSSDYFIEVSLMLKNDVFSYLVSNFGYDNDVFLEAVDAACEILDNCYIVADVFDEIGNFVKTECYYDLDIFKDLFSTTQVIKHL
ncbi:MAG: hypothetical protein H7836_13155 [Magnetococcus sp. YQC-3]